MKKLFGFLLSVIIIFSFASCNKEKTTSPEVDLEYYANLGVIPELDYKLGEDIDKINNELDAKMNKNNSEDSSSSSDDHSHSDFYYNITEGKKSVIIDVGSSLYYYAKENKANGVSFMVSLDKSFGFENGTVILEVTNALNGYEYVEEAPNKDNSFFILGDLTDGTVLKYTFGDKVILFVFENNSLCATALYDINNWNL